MQTQEGSWVRVCSLRDRQQETRKTERQKEETDICKIRKFGVD